MTDRQLIEAAKEAMKNAYAPYSNFKVGAALLLSDGTVYKGCNIENNSYGATICAERTAIFKAVSDGRRDFEKIAIVSSGKGKTYPCGICRQVMAEFMIDKSVVLEDEKGEITKESVRSLIPNSFIL